jgi:hypothetical protein
MKIDINVVGNLASSNPRSRMKRTVRINIFRLYVLLNVFQVEKLQLCVVHKLRGGGRSKDEVVP